VISSVITQAVRISTFCSRVIRECHLISFIFIFYDDGRGLPFAASSQFHDQASNSRLRSLSQG
jgi:hypothetical protein